jgi:hypothetical protein
MFYIEITSKLLDVNMWFDNFALLKWLYNKFKDIWWNTRGQATSPNKPKLYRSRPATLNL